ncbi:MAG: hypothetical protein ACOYB4_04410 [Methyloceanibacter sp.]
MARYSYLQCAAFVLTACVMLATAAVPALADKPLTNLGPVGPGEPILVTVGGQRVIAFYASERGECAVNAVMWREASPDAPYASTRVRLSLKPGQTIQLDGTRQAMSLLCGSDAATLAVVAPAELLVTSVTGSN